MFSISAVSTNKESEKARAGLLEVPRKRCIITLFLIDEITLINEIDQNPALYSKVEKQVILKYLMTELHGDNLLHCM